MNAPLQRLLREQRETLLADWLHALRAVWSAAGTGDPDLEFLAPRLREILGDLQELFDSLPEAPQALAPDDPRLVRLRALVIDQARQGVSAATAAELLASLRRLLMTRLESTAGEQSAAALRTLTHGFDRLLPLAFNAFVESRERLIAQQSLSLLELSTPVLRVWHRILLLPLVGVVDTARARQFTERLLEAVARHEALVTIIDVTGVPVLDTSVAQHLMKTIDAARLLGTRIVMTGISPEGAQTLTKLGIRFADVISRASLRAGIAEALHMVGQRIVTLPPPGDLRG